MTPHLCCTFSRANPNFTAYTNKFIFIYLTLLYTQIYIYEPPLEAHMASLPARTSKTKKRTGPSKIVSRVFVLVTMRAALLMHVAVCVPRTFFSQNFFLRNCWLCAMYIRLLLAPSFLFAFDYFDYGFSPKMVVTNIT